MVMVVSFWGYATLLLVRFFRRRRPDLAVTGPMALGYAVRVLSIAAISATGIGVSLRGGDEITFVSAAHTIAASPFGSSAWLPFGHYGLYEIVFALQLHLGGFTVAAMRVTNVGLAMLGVVLLVVSVYDLAGRRAARWAAWLLAIEPVSIFFSEILHKEPFMTLASGLVVYGCTKIWKRLSFWGLIPVAAGGAIAVATRPYAGWFLVAGAVFLPMHAAVRQLKDTGRAMAMLLGVVGLVAVAAPIVIKASSPQNLKQLQVSQTANTSGTGPGNNLALEDVNFSSRGAIITNLPQRISDLLIKPFPWQLGDASQRIGALGTLIAYAVFFLLVLYAIRMRGAVFDSAAPIIYPALLVLVSYSLSVGNAGTGFRYRSHLVILALCVLGVLRSRWLAATAPASVRQTRPPAPALEAALA